MKTKHYNVVTVAGRATQIVQLRRRAYATDTYFQFYQPKNLIVNVGSEDIYFHMLSNNESVDNNADGILLQNNTEYSLNLDGGIYQVGIIAVNPDATGYTESTTVVSCYNHIQTGEDYYSGTHNQGDI